MSSFYDGLASLYHLIFPNWDESIERCIFLSGGERLSCQSRAELSLPGSDSKPLVLYSIHCTGLYSPYPLANPVEKPLAGDESFAFPHPHQNGRKI